MVWGMANEYSDNSSGGSDTPQPQRVERAGKRSAVAIPTMVKDASGGNWPGEIQNLSARGCRVSFRSERQIPPGRIVTVGIRGIEAQAATAVWSKGTEAGFEFLHPLYEAVFENLAQRFPASESILTATSDEWRSG